jgi:hypothetical protein
VDAVHPFYVTFYAGFHAGIPISDQKLAFTTESVVETSVFEFLGRLVVQEIPHHCRDKLNMKRIR